MKVLKIYFQVLALCAGKAVSAQTSRGQEQNRFKRVRSPVDFTCRSILLIQIGKFLPETCETKTIILDRKSTRLNSSHVRTSRMPSSA